MNQLLRRVLYMLFGAVPCGVGLAFFIYLVSQSTVDFTPLVTVLGTLALFGFGCGLVAIVFLNNLGRRALDVVQIGVVIGTLLYLPVVFLALVELSMLTLALPTIVGAALIFEINGAKKAAGPTRYEAGEG